MIRPTADASDGAVRSPSAANGGMVESMRARTAAAASATALLGAGAAAVAAGRRATRRALRTGEDPPVPAGFRRRQLTVLDHTAGLLTLSAPSGGLPSGRYALIGREGHAEVAPPAGPSVPPPEGTVPPAVPDPLRLRPLRTTGIPFAAGDRLWLTPQLYRGDPGTAFGMEYAEVDIPGELGPLPGWFVPGTRDLWVLALHGLGATRELPMNVLPFLHEQDFPVLLPGYRGDPGAPPSPGGVGRLGATEWRDADAALRYAVRYGARRVLVLGWSVGAAMALRLAAESPLRSWIAGLVLDSPVLDWPATLRAVAAERGVPGPLLPLTAGAAEGGAGLSPAVVPDPPARPSGAPLPVLLVHGPDDTVARWEPSRELAARHPRAVQLHTVPGADHAAMWNADPDGYEETLRRFTTPLA